MLDKLGDLNFMQYMLATTLSPTSLLQISRVNKTWNKWCASPSMWWWILQKYRKGGIELQLPRRQPSTVKLCQEWAVRYYYMFIVPEEIRTPCTVCWNRPSVSTLRTCAICRIEMLTRSQTEKLVGSRCRLLIHVKKPGRNYYNFRDAVDLARIKTLTNCKRKRINDLNLRFSLSSLPSSYQRSVRKKLSWDVPHIYLLPAQ
jgi:hypothetical protein